MDHIRFVVGSIVTAAALFAAAPALAQPGMGMGPAASSPGGPGRMGMGMHRWQMHRDNTPGWSMMTPAERAEHERTMRGHTDHGQCHAYMEQHHAQMVERAKQRGHAAPAMPRHDACAALKKP